MSRQSQIRRRQQSLRNRKFALESLERRELMATFTVINSDNAGTGSLRAAINLANNTPGYDVIAFNIPGAGNHVIQPTQQLPALTEAAKIDGYTQPGAAVNTLADGFNAVLPIKIDGNALPVNVGANGLVINAAGCTIRGLDIAYVNTADLQHMWQVNSAVGGNGILVTSSDNVIEGNLIHFNEKQGIQIETANNNLIGGTTPAARNFIRGNVESGVVISGYKTTGAGHDNKVQGNFIGNVEKSLQAYGNARAGVRILNGAYNNVVGGPEAGARNIISENDQYGVLMDHNANGVVLDPYEDYLPGEPHDNRVEGNYIGTNPLGTAAAANDVAGVAIKSGKANVVGGAEVAKRNIISGNGTGVSVAGSDHLVLGNFIGTNMAGSGKIANTVAGVQLDGVACRVGGAAAGEANVVSGNAIGVLSVGGAGKVQGNRIGLKATGNANDALPNTLAGIKCEGGNPTIGGLAANEGNWIARNSGAGIWSTTGKFLAQGNNISFNAVAGLVVEGSQGAKLSGRDAANKVVAPNRVYRNFGPGVWIKGGATATVIEGNQIGISDDLYSNNVQVFASPNASAGVYIDNSPLNTVTVNQIAGNQTQGVLVQGGSAAGNTVSYNTVGWEVGLGNGSDGIRLQSAPENTVQGNLVYGNVGQGIALMGAGTASNQVLDNTVGVRWFSYDYGNAQNGIFLYDGAAQNTVKGNTVGGNHASGIYLSGPTTTGNTIHANRVGVHLDSQLNKRNDASGIYVNGAAYNHIGGSGAGEGNTVGNHANYGILVQGADATGNSVLGNWVGIRDSYVQGQPGSVKKVAGNIKAGIAIDQAPGNTIGGSDPGEGNVVAGNAGAGVLLLGAFAKNNVVQGNSLGYYSAALAAGNGQGLIIDAARENTIGGAALGEGNVVILNREGIRLRNGATLNTLYGNLVGVAADGATPHGNIAGGVIVASSPANYIGGVQAGQGNVVSANGVAGVQILNAASTGNWVHGNLIGVGLDGATALQNNGPGVRISAAPSTSVGYNTIANNHGDGVEVIGNGALNNTIRSNSIYDNGDLGIDLGGDGVTANDNLDGDSGPNSLQNKPAISFAQVEAGKLKVSISLNSAANKTYILDIYWSPAVNAQGFGEGKKLLGSVTVTTNAAGNAGTDALVDLPPGDGIITTTATLVAGRTYRGTSEFSAPLFFVNQGRTAASAGSIDQVFAMYGESDASRKRS